MASTASLSPLHDVEDAGRQAGLQEQLGDAQRHAGVALADGFRMKALPQAMAGAHFHSGIMAGKLNGVMPATTPSGWRIE